MRIPCIGGRIIKPELLDTLPPDAARASLADLVRLNRDFGGHAVLRRMLGALVSTEDSFSLLDVGAASGDMGATVRQLCPRATVASLDYLASHLAAAAEPRVAGDAFCLPFRPRSFDYVLCSLFLHHFTNEQVVALLASFGAAARRAVLAIDLERNPIPYFFLPATAWLYRWDKITLHDGPISVEAAFRPHELQALAARAGLLEPHVQTHRPSFRISLVGRPR
ncbi:MAG: methyltransferase domain-containing protein [Bryobacteraceae bacterium]